MKTLFATCYEEETTGAALAWFGFGLVRFGFGGFGLVWLGCGSAYRSKGAIFAGAEDSEEEIM